VHVHYSRLDSQVQEDPTQIEMVSTNRTLSRFVTTDSASLTIVSDVINYSDVIIC
jgi:hypothetical protein